MTKFVPFQMVSLILLLVMANSCRKTPAGARIPETQTNSLVKTEAPPECLAVFRAIFDYVRKSEPSLITDQQAQERWLSKLFRKSLAAGIKRAGKPKDNPD